MKAAPPPPTTPPPLPHFRSLRTSVNGKNKTNMKDKITDTWTFQLKTVFQIGLVHSWKKALAQLVVTSPTLPEVLFVSR